jgi:hypothetical protein
MDIRLARMELSKDVALVRAQYEMPLPFNFSIFFGQPEVFFSPHRPASRWQVACGIERVIAPGDAIAWCQLRMSSENLRELALIGTLQSSVGFATVRVRHLIRRDFPHEGSFTIVAAPLHPETDALIDELFAAKSAVAILEAHSDPSKTKITEVKLLKRVPAWAVPRAFGMHFKQQFDTINDYTDSSVFQNILMGAGRYIVVGIRRCSKGPPLLPSKPCRPDEVSIEAEWLEAESGGVRFGLPEYLTAFLANLGITDTIVYDRIHGRQVVRYQAVLQSTAWEQVWAVLEAPFRVQRAAYRRRHGGSNAPDITIDMEPKFLATSSSAAPYPAGDSAHTSLWPTARTFIHFSDGVDSDKRFSLSRLRQQLGHDPAYVDTELTLPSEYQRLAERF